MTLTFEREAIDEGLGMRGDLRTLAVEDHRGLMSRNYWTGAPWQLGTAAYWEALARQADPPPSYRLGKSLAEEVGACLVGGFGMPFQLGNAAFIALQQGGVFESDQPSAGFIESLLRQPLRVDGTLRRYRFPRQRAGRLANALSAIAAGSPPSSARELRDWLLIIPGIGLKTASWIARNHLSSSEVAIIDIHIERAGAAAGVFDPEWRVRRDYRLYEQAFLQWAQHAQVDAALLDASIWGVLAHAGSDARDILGVTSVSLTPAAIWPTQGTGTLASPHPERRRAV